jgi:hypothetical protein
MPDRIPKWTPPINGWQYRIREIGPKHSRELRAATTEFVLWRNLDTGGPWHVSYCSGFNSTSAAGSLDHCCDVLNDALARTNA